ncbi:PWI domain-containing protein [Pyronema omphalodes]|nr:PWI domain-containing protein [Pyronema omphalodes]
MASGVDAKLLKSTKFPPEYSKKVDMQKVNLEVMKQWIAQKVVEILATEDDVVIDFIFGMLEDDRFPDPKRIQLNITGFLEKDAPTFCKQLWNLLLSAQSNPQGVPTELLEKKKEELRQQKVCIRPCPIDDF